MSIDLVEEMTCFEKTSIVIQSLVALGTILLAIVAIWGDWLKGLFVTPRLEVRLRKAEGELTKFTNGTLVRYYHLDVINHRQAIPARNVTVFLVGAYRVGPDGNWQPTLPCGPVPLNWQFGVPVYSMGPARVCDLGHISKGESFVVEISFTPNNFNAVVGANERLLLRVMAVAENARQARRDIEISWDGQWDDGDSEMARHLIVKETSSAV